MARRRRFDELGHTPTIVGLLAGVLLIVLGRALRAGDDHLADFD